jgi:predicted DNA-binding transcriptional regulator AlpA
MSLLNPELLEVALRPLIENIIEEKLEPRLAELISLHSISTENEKPIPVSEMSKILGISISHLYKKCNSSNMPHNRKFGRIYFYLSDIRKWMSED